MTDKERTNIKNAMEKYDENTQHYEVLEQLLKRGSVTTLDMVDKMRTTKISNVLSELKRDGLPIISVYVKKKSGGQYCRYYWNEKIHADLKERGEAV